MFNKKKYPYQGYQGKGQAQGYQAQGYKSQGYQSQGQSQSYQAQGYQAQGYTQKTGMNIMKESIAKGITKFLESTDLKEKQDSNFLDAFNIVGGRSSKIHIDNKIKDKERLTKSDFLHFNLKALVEYRTIYGNVDGDDYYIEPNIEPKDKLEEVILKWENGIVSNKGDKWYGWDKENNIYLEHDTKISKNFKGMIIFEIIEYDEINISVPDNFMDNLIVSIKEKFKGRMDEDSINKLIQNMSSENIQDKIENLMENLKKEEQNEKKVVDKKVVEKKVPENIEEKKVVEKEKKEINDKMSLKELKEIAKEKGIKNYSKYTSKNKDELVELIKEDNKGIEKEDKKGIEKEDEKDKEKEINDKMSLKELKEIAKEKGIKNYSKYTSKNKDELVELIKEDKKEQDKKEQDKKEDKKEINDKMSLKELKEIAKEKGIKNYSKYTSKNKDELVELIKKN